MLSTIALALLIGQDKGDKVIGKLGQTTAEGHIHVAPDETSKIYSAVRMYQYLVINPASNKHWYSVVMSNGQSGYILASLVNPLPYAVSASPGAFATQVPLAEHRDKRITPLADIPLSYAVGKYRTESREIAQYLPKASEEEINLLASKLELRSNKTFTAKFGSTTFGGTFTFNGQAKRIILVAKTVNGRTDKSPAKWFANILTDGVRKYIFIEETEVWLEKTIPGQETGFKIKRSGN